MHRTLALGIIGDAWDIPVSVGIGVFAWALLALAALGWLWLSTAPTRIAAGAPTQDLGEENPAIVDLLTGGFDVDDDAIPATVVDLAARTFLDIDELGGDVVLRPREHTSANRDELEPYERRVLTHIESHTINGVVNARVLTIGPDGVSERWFKGFTREVNKHGQQLGLCRRRFDLKHLAIAWGIVVVGAAPAWAVASGGRRTADPHGWGSIGNLLVGGGILVGLAMAALAGRISKGSRQVDTDHGRARAEHWLGVREHMRAVGDFRDKPAASVAIWDRHLAYATAMGLAPTVQRQLPFETEHDRKAWSRVTGDWRQVKVRYQAMMPRWGDHPGKVAFESLIQGAISGLIAYGAFLVASGEFDLGALTDAQRQWVSLGGLAVAVLAAAVTLVSAIKLLVGLADLFAKQTIEGEVVRSRVLRTGHRLPKIVQLALYHGRDEHGMRRDRGRRTRHFAAIDDGTTDSILANVVRQKLYAQVAQGARVRAVVTPRLGYVREIVVTAPPATNSPAHAPLPRHELVAEVTNKATAKIAGGLTAAMSQLESATDRDGKPVLDQVDDEGVSMRERMQQGSDQIAALRNDPRLRNSPVGGLLDSLFAGTEPTAAAPDDQPDDA